MKPKGFRLPLCTFIKIMQRHPFLYINAKAKDYDAEHAAYQCEQWLTQYLIKENCRGRFSNNYKTKCTCLHALQEDNKAEVVSGIARYMAAWLTFPNHTQQELLSMWDQFANSIAVSERNTGKIKYTLPMSEVPDQPLHRVCKNALWNVLNVGTRKWNSALLDPSKLHALKGKKGDDSNRGKNMCEVYDSLHEYFVLLEKESLPFATRIIREQTGFHMRDEDPNAVLLPPHMSKQRCYAQWCFRRGWVVKKRVFLNQSTVK